MKMEKYLLQVIASTALICLFIVCYGLYYTSISFHIPIQKMLLTGGFPLSIWILLLIIFTGFLLYTRILLAIIFIQILWSAYSAWPLWEGLWVIKAVLNIFNINTFPEFLISLEGLCILFIWMLTLLILINRIINYRKTKKPLTGAT